MKMCLFLLLCTASVLSAFGHTPLRYHKSYKGAAARPNISHKDSHFISRADSSLISALKHTTITL